MIIQINVDYVESIKAIEYLDNINLDSDSAELEVRDILNSKIIVPYIQVTIPEGLEIYRARKNEMFEEFTKKEQISYNPNIDKISTGRANRKGQSIFYASHNLETTLFETSSLTKFGTNVGKEIFTIGRWRVKKPFRVVTLLPQLAFSDTNTELINRYIKIISQTLIFQNIEMRKHIEFFSNQFAKRVSGNENSYIISSEYFNTCLERSSIKIYGMLYPSVEYEQKDLNLALIPEAVDEFLILDMVVKYEMTITPKNGIILPLGIGEIKNYEF